MLRVLSPSAGKRTHSVRHSCSTTSSPYNTEMSPSWPDPSSTSSSGTLPKAQMIWSSWSHPVHPVSTSPGSGTYHQACKANRGTCYPDRPKSYLALRRTGATYTWSCLSSRTWYHTKQSVISSRTSHPGSEPHPWWLTPRMAASSPDRDFGGSTSIGTVQHNSYTPTHHGRSHRHSIKLCGTWPTPLPPNSNRMFRSRIGKPQQSSNITNCSTA